jgi:hypothetical protein
MVAHSQNSIRYLFRDVGHGFCQIRGGKKKKKKKKKTLFLIWGAVRTKSIPPTKKFGKHCSNVRVYDITLLSPMCPFQWKI